MRIIGIILAGGLGFGLMFYAGENLRGKAAWDNFRKEWEAKGEVFEYQKIIPPEVPTDKNFAHTPLLKPLLEHQWAPDFSEAIKEPDPAKIKPANDLMALKTIPRDQNSWRSGRPVDLTAWQKAFRNDPDWPNPDEAGNAAEDILIALKKHDAEFAELARASVDRPQCRFDIEYRAGFATMLPHLSVLRNVGRGLAVRSLAHLEQNQPDLAWADAKLCLYLAECIRTEPLLISQLVRIAILEVGLQPVWEGLRTQSWTKAQLKDIERTLADIDVLEGYRISILGERNLGLMAIDHLSNSSAKEIAALTGGQAGAGLPMAVIPSGWIAQNKKNIASIHVKFTQRVVDAKARLIKPAVADAMDDHIENLPRNPYHIMVALLMPAISRVAVKNGYLQGGVDMARIACRLELYQQEHGQYPKTLADLESALPHDPMTGKDYGYTVLPEARYRLHSVGWDQKDDGAKPAFQPGQKQPTSESGDWVWQYTPVPLPVPPQPGPSE